MQDPMKPGRKAKKREYSDLSRTAENAVSLWSQATALAIELMKAGIRLQNPHLNEEEVLRRCRERLARAREGKYGARAKRVLE